MQKDLLNFCKVLILSGPQASGKSTFAKELVRSQGAIRINRDTLRKMLHFSQYIKEQELFVLAARDAVLRAMINNNHPLIVIDDTNTTMYRLQGIYNVIKLYPGVEGHIKFFDTSLDECLARNARRTDDYVPDNVIYKFYHDYLLLKEQLKTYNPFSQTLRHNLTLMIDFDGVIHSYKSGWQGINVIPDSPNEGAREAIEQLRSKYNVIVHTTRARALDGFEAVKLWLEMNDIQVDGITHEKLPALFYLDDRAKLFEGWNVGYF